MISNLWRERDRQPFGSKSWLKAWAKRVQQLPNLLKQSWYHQCLRRGGATVDSSAFFSDARQVSGQLSNLSVGANSFVGRAELSVHAPLTIGSNVCINDGARILTASHDVYSPDWPTIARPIVIDDYVWIAVDAIILPGVTLGRGAVVGAGAVVSKNVPASCVVVGNPSHILQSRRPEQLDYSPTASLALFRSWKTGPIPPSKVEQA